MLPSMPGPVHQHLADPSLPAGTTLEGLAQSRGHLRPVLHMPRTDQDLEVFKADMTSMLADMLKSSLSNFVSQLPVRI